MVPLDMPAASAATVREPPVSITARIARVISGVSFEGRLARLARQKQQGKSVYTGTQQSVRTCSSCRP